MKKYWEQIVKRPVRIDKGGVSFGRINGVFISPDTGQVIAYMVGLTKVLVPVDVRKWGSESVLISESEALVSPMEIHRLQSVGLRKALLNGKKVRSKSGYSYGFIRDFQLDLTTNILLNFEASKRFLGFEWGKRQFSLRDIDHMTENTIVVLPEPMKKARVKMKTPVPTT